MSVRRLPLDPVLVAISELLPKVQEVQPLNNAGPSKAVLDLLRHASLKDVLPVHVHTPRKFQVSIRVFYFRTRSETDI